MTSAPIESGASPVPGKELRGEWLVPWRFAVLLGLLIIVSFPKVICGFNALLYLDSGQFAYPVAFYQREAFWRGELPLWNPLNDCGIPFLAQWNTLCLYPPSLIYLLLPIPWSFGVFCLAHLFLAGMGMYFLAFRWTENRVAAALAGTAFGFNGLSWYGLMWPHMLGGLAWMPWVILAMERGWREGGRFLVGGALAAGMQFLSGGAEVIVQTWIMLVVLWCVLFFQGRVARSRLIGGGLISAVLGLGMAAAQLLPFCDLLLHSQRNASYGSSDLAAMPITGWANYLVPLFHCALNQQGVPVQAGQPWTASYYLGVGPVVLAMLAIWRVRNWRVHLLFAAMIFGLIMALGGHTFVYDFCKRIVPGLGMIRFPAKFAILTSFSIPLLGAYGLKCLQEVLNGGSGEWRRIRKLSAGLLILMGAIVVFAWKFPAPQEALANTGMNALTRAAFLIFILVCLKFLLSGSARLPAWLGPSVLVVLLWCDVLTSAPNLSPTAEASVSTPDTVRDFSKWGTQLYPGISRAMQGRGSFWTMLTRAKSDLSVDITGRRLALFNDCNLLDHAAKVDGFWSLELKDYTDVLNQLYHGINEAAPLKSFLGISQTTNPTNPVSWVPCPTPLPMITAGQQPVFLDKEDTLKAILSPEFAPLHEVYLPAEFAGSVSAKADDQATITSPQVSGEHVSFQVDTREATMVVVAQAYYHCWRAYVDEEPARIRPANYAFQTLAVPAGRHQVRLVYRDDPFYLGVLGSCLSLLAGGILWLRRGGVRAV